MSRRTLHPETPVPASPFQQLHQSGEVELVRPSSMQGHAKAYDGCPVNLSPALLSDIVTAIQDHKKILSINCSTGALEAYLIQQNEILCNPDLKLFGWLKGPGDTPKPPYLPWGCVQRIMHERDKWLTVEAADALIFVNPDVEEARTLLGHFPGKSVGKSLTIVSLSSSTALTSDSPVMSTSDDGAGLGKLLRSWAAENEATFDLKHGDGKYMTEGDSCVFLRKRSADGQ